MRPFEGDESTRAIASRLRIDDPTYGEFAPDWAKGLDYFVREGTGDELYHIIEDGRVLCGISGDGFMAYGNSGAFFWCPTCKLATILEELVK